MVGVSMTARFKGSNNDFVPGISALGSSLCLTYQQTLCQCCVALPSLQTFWQKRCRGRRGPGHGHSAVTHSCQFNGTCAEGMLRKQSYAPFSASHVPACADVSRLGGLPHVRTDSRWRD